MWQKVGHPRSRELQFSKAKSWQSGHCTTEKRFHCNIKKNKADRITSITSKTFPPADPKERKIRIRKMVTDIFEALIPGFLGKIMFVNQMKNKGQQVPVAEAKMDSVVNATAISRAFAENNNLGQISVTDSFCLATRVRVDNNWIS